MISHYNYPVLGSAPPTKTHKANMYSSYGNNRRNANVLRFTPPGFQFPIDVQFPPRCLPVCERCKKNFKTREHCRGRDCHTDLAWCETYVCVSLDASCLGEDGKLLDGPFMAKVVPPIAFNLKGKLNPLTPICAPCKDKNYTRTYCRQNKGHRQLPWSTVYVICSLKPGVQPTRTSAASDSPSNKRRKGEDGESLELKNAPGGESSDDLKHKNDSSKEAGDDKAEETKVAEKKDDAAEGEKDSGKKEGESEKKEDTKEADDSDKKEEKELSIDEIIAREAKKMEDIPRSRTFLATVSCKTHLIEVCFLEFCEVDCNRLSSLLTCLTLFDLAYSGLILILC